MNEDTNSNTTSTEPSDIKSQVLAFRDNAHAANVKKLKAGIKCIFTVPACFLILLFLTGQLHMGHALDSTLQDILTRYKIGRASCRERV